MGGKMDYQRFRNRNGLGTQFRPSNGEDPYAIDQSIPGAASLAANGRSMLVGDLNRMESDLLGMQEVARASRATGVDREAVLKVLRWTLCLPEPGCDDCGKATDFDSRCPRHNGTLGNRTFEPCICRQYAANEAHDCAYCARCNAIPTLGGWSVWIDDDGDTVKVKVNNIGLHFNFNTNEYEDHGD